MLARRTAAATRPGGRDGGDRSTPPLVAITLLFGLVAAVLALLAR
jgi:hypothetical protein